MSTKCFYELQEPTCWAKMPARFSFSTLQYLRGCSRQWQLLHSAWGDHLRFPERPCPDAIVGQIVHAGLELLTREVGVRGAPPIESVSFKEAVEKCGFWDFFGNQIDEWNRRLASHPRAGPRYLLRSTPRELANQAICLFRERYVPGNGRALNNPKKMTHRPESASGDYLTLLRSRGILAEVRLEHPTLPFVGVIDLITLDHDETTIITDFKTGLQKQTHEEQVMLYSLLWWRVTGVLPGLVVVQYLDSNWSYHPTQTDLEGAEKALEKDIGQAVEMLSAGTLAPASAGEKCKWCTVRARCNEGWLWVERVMCAPGSLVDIEVCVSSEPTSNGFIGTRLEGEEVSVVFDVAVGNGLPELRIGDRFRLVDAVRRAEGDGNAVELLPWSEMYRVL